MTTLWKYIRIEVLGDKPKASYTRNAYILLFGSANTRCILFYRLAKYLYDKGHRLSGKLFFRKLERDYGVYIHPRASIGLGIKLPHPTGIVIGAGVQIGENVTIFQQVTLGGARLGDAKDNNYPNIGNDSVLFSGAKLIGAIHVGNKCVIGANAVVIHDVPDGATAVGVPARILGNKQASHDTIPSENEL